MKYKLKDIDFSSASNHALAKLNLQITRHCRSFLGILKLCVSRNFGIKIVASCCVPLSSRARRFSSKVCCKEFVMKISTAKFSSGTPSTTRFCTHSTRNVRLTRERLAVTARIFHHRPTETRVQALQFRVKSEHVRAAFEGKKFGRRIKRWKNFYDRGYTYERERAPRGRLEEPLGIFLALFGEHLADTHRDSVPCFPDGFDAPLSVHMFRRYRAMCPV